MRTMCRLFRVLVLAILASRCGGTPIGPSTASPPAGPALRSVSLAAPAEVNNFPTDIRVYSSMSAAGPWVGPELVTVAGHDAKGLVDPSPIVMRDGSILLYYAMAEDNALTVMPRIGVAESTDGRGFVHKGVAYASTGVVTDPFPLRLSDGRMRLFFSNKSPAVLSVTAGDTTGVNFAPTADAGMRSTTGGVPGALTLGSTTYLYVNGSGVMDYLTSSNGLDFSSGGSTALAGESASPIDSGDGTYLMSYTCGGSTDARTQVSCIASSADGRTWTQIAQIGLGSVPALARLPTGELLVYVVYFPDPPEAPTPQPPEGG